MTVRGSRVSTGEWELIEGVGRGDESAFERLVDAHGSSLLRFALHLTPSRAIAEEVVQETWVAFLQGLDRFEGRSSLRTWLFGILVNRARKAALRERRSFPLSELADENDDEVDPERFIPAGQRWAGHWRYDDPTVAPRRWSELPEARLLSGELKAEIAKAVERLPVAQREVFALRDVEGWITAEACDVLGLTQANERVLLHRARSKVRAHLERYLGG